MEQGSVLADRALFFARTSLLHKKGGGLKVVAFFTGGEHGKALLSDVI